jgi:hypothetical protein
MTVTTFEWTAANYRSRSLISPGSALAAVLCLFGIRKRRRLLMLLSLAVGSLGLSILSGCSATLIPAQPVTSIVTVTATSVSITHTGAVTLTLN